MLDAAPASRAASGLLGGRARDRGCGLGARVAASRLSWTRSRCRIRERPGGRVAGTSPQLIKPVTDANPQLHLGVAALGEAAPPQRNTPPADACRSGLLYTPPANLHVRLALLCPGSPA
ncbi:hypothetical protein NDU88_004738 [Pleurodeles waltl]|uniref:Uncharacterized protein n=1 Tax=Pleurodeles waltl TaxID=8319 RepID=A0AAV7W5T9_PLEWA|nr:hypothetical protein NDU88_004738 [Pleurodeles waltl]